MIALTIRLPDDKHRRLKELSKRRGPSLVRKAGGWDYG